MQKFSFFDPKLLAKRFYAEIFVLRPEAVFEYSEREKTEHLCANIEAKKYSERSQHYAQISKQNHIGRSLFSSAASAILKARDAVMRSASSSDVRAG